MANTSNLGHPVQSIRLSLKKDITAEQIQQALGEIYKAAGCHRCGLLGFDVRLQVIDPPLQSQFDKIGGVAGVSALGVRA